MFAIHITSAAPSNNTEVETCDMECDHNNSARCGSPPLSNTVVYWSAPQFSNEACEKCLKKADYNPPLYRKCLVCHYLMCHDCWYDMVGRCR